MIRNSTGASEDTINRNGDVDTSPERRDVGEFNQSEGNVRTPSPSVEVQSVMKERERTDRTKTLKSSRIEDPANDSTLSDKGKSGGPLGSSSICR